MRANEPGTGDWTQVEKAYSAWIRAAREKATADAAASGKVIAAPVELVRMMAEYLKKSGMLEKVSSPKWASRVASEEERKWASRRIAAWERGAGTTGRPQYPGEEPLREALVEAVTALVLDPPVEMDWRTFAEVCHALDAERLEAQGRGGPAEQARAVRERNERRHHFLAAWPTTAGDLDPIGLGLGSWAFGGALPPYVPRTADTDLDARLGTPGAGITVVVGAPKSGKSRSILQALQRHHPEAITWWVNPSPTVLPLVVQAAREACKKDAKPQERPVFIVLDDAGLIGTDPTGGLTAQRLTDLAAACVYLLVVIHDQTLAEWEHQLTQRIPDEFDAMAVGATHELMDLLRYRIRYESVLDETEIGPAADAYEGADRRVKSFDQTRLAETLAGVEMLLAKARRILKTPASAEAALLEAAIDATIAFPAGTREAILALLAREHYRRRQPNRPWRAENFNHALDILTTGITVGSPHAILTATEFGEYRLLDSLTTELQQRGYDSHRVIRILRKSHDESGQVSLLDLEEALWNTGLWHDTNDQKDRARRIWMEAVDLGSTRAMLGLGQIALEAQDEAAARTWFRRFTDNGGAGDVRRVTLLADEDLAAKRSRWMNAAKNGNSHAMFNLGALAHQDGDEVTARSWFELAAENGSAEAMYNLGVLAYEDGDEATVRSLWEDAAKIGSAEAMFNLGVLAYEDGDEATVRSQWEDAAKIGSAEAMFNLGVLAYEDGDAATARSQWEDAADKGFVMAMDALAELEEEQGEEAEASRWHARAEEARKKTGQA